MKRLKRIMALVIAMAMVLTMMSMAAFAAYTYTRVEVGATYDSNTEYFTDEAGTAYTGGADGFEAAVANGLYTREGEEDPAPPTPTPTGNPEPGEFNHGEFNGSTPDGTIEATNVTAGDSVDYYQLVEWDTSLANWKLTTLGSSCGVTLDELINGITETESATIATNLANAAATGNMTASDPATTFTASVAPGLYYLKATPAATNKDVIYNPAFVSSDYYEGGNTVDFSSEIGSSAVLKKSGVPFDKEVTGTDKYVDVKPGDIIPYKITTTIPSFGQSYKNPKFVISDDLSAGLKLSGDITVTYGENTATATVTDVLTIAPDTADGGGFTITFAKSFLTGLLDEMDVTVEYSAEVTSAATENVNVMDNKAKLTFSNTPSTEVDKEDITRHYTFSIDGNLLGSSNNQTDELIKVACDKDGNPIYDQKTTYYGTQVNPLDGASFTLTPVAPTTGTAKTVSSADGGHIQFLGLDAGEYTLVENSAPQGYVKDSRTWTVKIIPHYDTTVTDLLLSYDVEFYVDGAKVTTSAFEVNNEGETTSQVVTSSDDTDAMQQIGNTPGAELPSTGGIGTTIFYVVGAILVLGAGVVLITRRRMDA